MVNQVLGKRTGTRLFGAPYEGACRQFRKFKVMLAEARDRKLFKAVADGDRKKTVSLLHSSIIRKGANVDAVNGWGMTLLMLTKDVEIARLLIKLGANVNAVDNWMMNALMRTQNAGIAKLIVDAGANLDLTDDRGMTALMYAINSRCVPIAELLIDKKANLSIIDAAGKTALMYAKDGLQATASAKEPGFPERAQLDSRFQRMISILESHGAK
jgi:hypothetical protein